MRVLCVCEETVICESLCVYVCLREYILYVCVCESLHL